MTQQEPDQTTEFSLSTRLALERTRIAYERTAMAWARTATSFITFGFAIYKFFEIETVNQTGLPRLFGSREFAFVLVGLGVVTLLVGRIEHRRDLRMLKKFYPDMPASGTRLISSLVAVFGALAMMAVLFGV
jgi:putative membrane protein